LDHFKRLEITLQFFTVQQLIMWDPRNRRSCSFSKLELSSDLAKAVSRMTWI